MSSLYTYTRFAFCKSDLPGFFLVRFHLTCLPRLAEWGYLGVFATALALSSTVKNKELLVSPTGCTVPVGILTLRDNHQLLSVFTKFVNPSSFIRFGLMEIPEFCWGCCFSVINSPCWFCVKSRKKWGKSCSFFFHAILKLEQWD